MSNPFSHPRRRIEHAKRHIASLDAHCKAYELSAKVLTVVDVDKKTGNLVHKAKLAAPMPDALIDDAVTAIESLRAALDQAGYAAAAACGADDLENTAFPFAADEKRLVREAAGKRGRSKHLPTPILELFLSFKPFPDGSYRLWTLNELAKGSKHRTVSPTLFGSNDAIMDSFQYDAGACQFSWPPKWDPDNEEAVFAIAHPSSRFRFAGSFKLLVALGGQRSFSKFRASDVLGVMADDVAEIVTATEDKVRELGFL